MFLQRKCLEMCLDTRILHQSGSLTVTFQLEFEKVDNDEGTIKAHTGAKKKKKYKNNNNTR